MFKISFGGFGPTESRVAMILANTLVFFLGNPTLTLFGVEAKLFSVLGAFGVGVLLVVYAVSALQERATLAVLDPPPQRFDQTAIGSDGGTDLPPEARLADPVAEEPAGSR